MKEWLTLNDRLPETKEFIPAETPEENKFDYYRSDPVVVYLDDEFIKRFSAVRSNYIVARLEYYPNAIAEEGMPSYIFFGDSQFIEEIPVSAVLFWATLPKKPNVLI
jgi:hypothetical protein